MKNPENIRELSSISLTEIAIKSTLGNLRFSAESARQAIDDMDIRILPFTAQHAYQLFELPAHHQDAFDRQIIEQSLAENIPLVTSDANFKMYPGIKIIW